MMKKTAPANQKAASHREQKGSSPDPKARASAARQRRPRSTAVHAPDESQPSDRPAPLLVKTVSVDLIKPLGGDTWESVGQRLRDLRGCAHRLLNAGIRAAAIGEQASKDVMASARAGVKGALESEREYWRSRIGKRYEGSNHDPERAERLSEIALPSVIEDHMASRAGKSFLDARKHMLRGDKSIPSAKRGAPIYLRDGATSWRLSKAEQGWELALKLFPGRSPMVRFAVRSHSASGFADLRRMVDPESQAKCGDARVVWHERGGKGQWEARLCYSAPKPKPAQGSEIVAVHRGMFQFLTIADTRPSVRRMPGDAWIKAKLGFSALRASLMRHIRAGELGHGARGHGVRRRYKALDALNDAEARMMKAACQQSAALVAKHALSVGASVVLIEDYGTTREEVPYVPKWPWAQLKGAIAWACEKNGLELREVPAEYISMRCPACEHVSADNLSAPKQLERTPEQRAFAKFECVECGLDWNVDSIAEFNLLAHEAGAKPVKDMRAALLRMGKAARVQAAE